MNHSAHRRLRVLILTKVFPNALQPLAAAFNRQQFACLARRGDLQVLAPIQWFPGAARTGQRTEAGRLRDLPDYEWIDGAASSATRGCFTCPGWTTRSLPVCTWPRCFRWCAGCAANRASTWCWVRSSIPTGWPPPGWPDCWGCLR